MNKLITPAIRASMTSDVKLQTKRWSLKSLATINIADDNDSISTQRKQPQQFTRKIGKLGDGLPPSSKVAETLLTDLRIRLAKQHQRIKLLGQQATMEWDDEDMVLSQSIREMTNKVKNISSESRGIKATVDEPRRIIRAANPKNWWKTSYEDIEEAIKLRTESQAILNDLVYLYEGTYELIYQIKGNNKDNDDMPSPILQRYSTADQSLVASTFEQIRSRHASTIEEMANAIIGLRQSKKIRDMYVHTSRIACGLDRNLIDTFLRSRLGVQLLCDHYVALDKGKIHGGISINCDIMDVLNDAITETRHICDGNFNIVPDIIVLEEGTSPRITLVRSWMHHILVEIIKNAVSSNIEMAKIQQNTDDVSILSPKPVYIKFVTDDDDDDKFLYIHIIDQGVGLVDDAIKHKAFLFAESSCKKRFDRINEQQSYASVQVTPINSLGVGLPLSKMMIQMFGDGDITLYNNNSNDDINGSTTATAAPSTGCTCVIKINKDDTILEKIVEEMIPVHHF